MDRAPGRLAPPLLALLAVGIHLACGDRYGFFRDELYFVACGQRLSWGYVDQPPLVALLARLGWWLSGEGGSVLRFRLPVIAAHGGAVLLAAHLARRLGGGAFAAALAAAVVAVAPLQLAQGHLLTMNALELLLWSGAAAAALAAVDGAPRAWLLAGLLLGLAVAAKYTGVLLGAALLAGLAASPSRRALATPWPWLGAAVAVAIPLPSILWQWAHGWPFVELVHNGQLYKNAPIPLPDLLAGVALEAAPVGMLLSVLGLGRLLFAREARPARFLGLSLALVLGALALAHAKPYYLGPAMPPLFAAGAVAAERRLRRGWSRGLLLGAALLGGVPGLPAALPILSPDATAAWLGRLGITPTRLERMDYPDLTQHLADQLGWPERVAAVEAVVRALPPGDLARAVVYAPNYGRAAALELLGHGLPPVVSGHNQYFLWGVPGRPEVVVAVGGRQDDYADEFELVEPAGATPRIPHGMPYESEIPLFVLRGPRVPVAELFQGSRHFE
jgi:hypothetical protein